MFPLVFIDNSHSIALVPPSVTVRELSPRSTGIIVTTSVRTLGLGAPPPFLPVESRSRFSQLVLDNRWDIPWGLLRKLDPGSFTLVAFFLAVLTFLAASEVRMLLITNPPAVLLLCRILHLLFLCLNLEDPFPDFLLGASGCNVISLL